MIRLTRAVWVVFGLVAIEAIFSTLSLNLELAMGGMSTGTITFSMAMTAIILWITYGHRELIAHCLQRLVRFAALFRGRQAELICIGLGVAFCVIWVVLYPAPLRSDYATYFSLAQKLADEGSYRITNGGYAYWPPGYPLFLYSIFAVFGVHTRSAIIANLLLWVATVIVAYRLAMLVLGKPAARFAIFLLVLWPANFTSAGLASKERLLVFLLPLAIWLFLLASRDGPPRKKTFLGFLTGLVLGFASLTQPSMLLFPGVLAAYELLCGEPRRFAVKFAPIIAAMVLTIVPWTFRNYIALGEWIPISTNGGDVFYRANNSLATGGYTPHGAQKIDHLDEVQRSKVGFKLGIEWITSNPADFANLAVRKQILFLGDDAHGVFESLKRGLDITDQRYLAFKAGSNLYWLAIWIIILSAVIRGVKKRWFNGREMILFMLTFLYFFMIHSIFESGGRQHEPLTVCLSILAGMIVSANDVTARKNELTASEEAMPVR